MVHGRNRISRLGTRHKVVLSLSRSRSGWQWLHYLTRSLVPFEGGLSPRQGLSVRFDDTVKYGHGLAKKWKYDMEIVYCTVWKYGILCKISQEKKVPTVFSPYAQALGATHASASRRPWSNHRWIRAGCIMRGLRLLRNKHYTVPQRRGLWSFKLHRNAVSDSVGIPCWYFSRVKIRLTYVMGPHPFLGACGNLG